MKSSRLWRVMFATGLGFFGVVALAFTPDQQSEALIAVAEEVAQTEAFVIACAQKFPETKTANQQAFVAWKSRNGLRDFDRVLAKVSQSKPEIAQALGKLRGSYVDLISKQSDAKLEPICRGLPKTLEQPNSNTIKSDHAHDLEVIAEIARGLDSPGASTGATNPQPAVEANPAVIQTGTVYSLAQLSGLMGGVYDATKPYGDKDDAVVAKLKSLGTIYLRGVAAENAWLVFERGKFASRYKASCEFNGADSSAFGKLIGREVVISGRIKEFQSYFGAVLTGCAVVLNPSGLKPSSLSEQAGLKRKPLTVQEVMTKPGMGLKTAQVRGLYFYKDQQTRMDGFGNSYVDVDERLYLVLKDGSAYQYDWGFPPEDFNVAVSKREEPQRWGRWNSGAYDGIDASDFDRVLPAPKGLRLERSFSLTKVGQGGSIRESGISFRRDGAFASDNFATVAGFTQGGGPADSGVTAGGTSVTTNGAGQSMVATAGSSSGAKGSYAIDGFAMTIKLSDGSISRSLFGIPESSSQTKPSYVIYRGSLWFADGK